MSTDDTRHDAEIVDRTLRTTQVVVLGLLVGVLVLAAIAGFVDVGGTVGARIAFPVAIVGLIAPVVGWRLYVMKRERGPVEGGIEARCGAYTTAVLLALAITEGAAFLGALAYMLGAPEYAMAGVLTHVLLAGAIWPGREKIEPFLR